MQTAAHMHRQTQTHTLLSEVCMKILTETHTGTQTLSKICVHGPTAISLLSSSNQSSA